MSPVLVNPYRFGGGGGGGGGSAAAYDAAVLTDTPWGFWKNDETSGTTLADSSGNSRPMTITGTPNFSQADVFGGTGAIKWPDSSGGTEYYAATSATLTTSNVTVEALVYLAATPTNQTGIVCCGTSYGGGGGDKYLYIGTDGKVRWYLFNSGQTTLVASVALALNTWHHVVASTGAAGSKIRIDKSTVATNASTGTYTGFSPKVFVHGGGSDGTGGDAVNATNSSELIISRAAFYTAQLSDARTDAHAAAAGF